MANYVCKIDVGCCRSDGAMKIRRTPFAIFPPRQKDCDQPKDKLNTMPTLFNAQLTMGWVYQDCSAFGGQKILLPRKSALMDIMFIVMWFVNYFIEVQKEKF